MRAVGWPPRGAVRALACRALVSGNKHNASILADFLLRDMQIIRTAAASSHIKSVKILQKSYFLQAFHKVMIVKAGNRVGFRNR